MQHLCLMHANNIMKPADKLSIPVRLNDAHTDIKPIKICTPIAESDPVKKKN